MTAYVAARTPSDKPGISAALLLFQVAGPARIRRWAEQGCGIRR